MVKSETWTLDALLTMCISYRLGSELASLV